jgi:hypothetical protein
MMDVGDVPIYLRPGFTDGRKAIDGLVGGEHQTKYTLSSHPFNSI